MCGRAFGSVCVRACVRGGKTGERRRRLHVHAWRPAGDEGQAPPEGAAPPAGGGGTALRAAGKKREPEDTGRGTWGRAKAQGKAGVPSATVPQPATVQGSRASRSGDGRQVALGHGRGGRWTRAQASPRVSQPEWDGRGTERARHNGLRSAPQVASRVQKYLREKFSSEAYTRATSTPAAAARGSADVKVEPERRGGSRVAS